MAFIKAYSSVRDDTVSVLSANSDVPYRATLAEALAEFPAGFYFKSDDKAGVGPHAGELWIYKRVAVAPGYEAQFKFVSEAVLADATTELQRVQNGVEYRRDTPESGLDLPVDMFFSSVDPQTGLRRRYRRVQASPGYLDVGPFVDASDFGYPNTPEDLPISEEQQAALDDRVTKEERTATLNALATDIPNLSIPEDVSVIRLAGYSPATRGLAAPAYIKTTKPGIKAYRVQDATGQRWQLIADVIKPKELGAPGKRDIDSTQGLVEAFGWSKELVEALLSGNPDEIHPRGMTVDLSTGFYETSQPIPIFDRLSLKGANQGNQDQMCIVRSSATSFFTKSQAVGGHATLVEHLTISGMYLYGRSDMTTNFIDAISTAGTAQTLRESVLSHLTLDRLRPPYLYLLLSDYHNNNHVRMPLGNLVVGGSDSSVFKNKFNGDAYNGFGLTSKDAAVLAYNFDNGHWWENYHTGSSIPGVRPVAGKFERCDETTILGNWFDLSDGPSLWIRNHVGGELAGNRLARAGLNAPSDAIPGRFTPMALLEGVVRTGIGRNVFRQNYGDPSAPTFVILDSLDEGPGSPARATNDITISRQCVHVLNSDGVTFTAGTMAIPPVGTFARNARIHVEEWERDAQTFAANMNAQFVQSAIYAYTGSAGAVITLPTAIKDRRFRVYYAGSAGATGFNTAEAAATNPIVGQDGMGKVRLAPSDAGKFVELYCITPGKWLVTSDAAGVTYAV